MIKGDLHIHTNYGDGAEDPIKMVRFSIRKGLRVIAITDHDTNQGHFRVMSFYVKPSLRN